MNKFFTDLKIGTRLLIGFGVLSVLLFGASGLALWGNNTFNEDLHAVVADSDGLERAYVMGGAVDKVFLDISSLTLAPDTEDLSTLQADITNQRALYKEDLTFLKAAAINDKELALLKNLDDAVVVARDASDQILALADMGNAAWTSGNRDGAQKIFHNVSFPANDLIDKAASDYINFRKD